MLFPQPFSFTSLHLVIPMALTNKFAYKTVFETIFSDSDLGDQ